MKKSSFLKILLCKICLYMFFLIKTQFKNLLCLFFYVCSGPIISKWIKSNPNLHIFPSMPCFTLKNWELHFMLILMILIRKSSNVSNHPWIFDSYEQCSVLFSKATKGDKGDQGAPGIPGSPGKIYHSCCF